MSDNSTLAAFEQILVEQYHPEVVENYSILAGAVLVFYDYLLTLPLELSYIWRRKVNLMTILFILNRYCGFLCFYSFIFYIFYKPAMDTECRVLNYITQSSIILLSFVSSSVFVLRTFAIYGRSWFVFLLLAVPGVITVASGIWQAVTQIAYAYSRQFQFGPYTCNAVTLTSFYASDLVTIVSNVVFDSLVVVLTVYRTARLARQSKQANIGNSLSIILLRDGLIYYVAAFVPAFVDVVLAAIILKNDSSILIYISAVFVSVFNALQIVVVNRIILNLSHSANASEESEFRTRNGLDTPLFAANSVLGNIGGQFRSYLDDCGAIIEGIERNADDETLPVMLEVRDDRGETSHSLGGGGNVGSHSQAADRNQVEIIGV